MICYSIQVVACNGKANITKIKKTLAMVMVLSTILSSTSTSAMTNENLNLTTENTNYDEQSDPIITINGCGYNAQEFMDRVLDYTIESDPISTIETEDGTEIEFEYNDSRQRTEKIMGQEITTYHYDESSNLESEVLPNHTQIDYLYKFADSNYIADSITYCNNEYHYIIENGIITGLLDSNNQTICTYTYDEYGATEHIYEIRKKKKIEHQDNSFDDFVGCVNSLRYDGECYDSETDMFCLNTGSYYDAETGELVGDKCYVDMEGIFGDQYETLSNQESQFSTDSDRNEVSLLSIPSPLQTELLYAATTRYNSAIAEDGKANTYSSTWYKKYSSSNDSYKLAARIIYAENTNKGSGSSGILYLKYNMPGIAWVITNRLLENKYRYNKGLSMCFSSTSTPSLYSVLTKSGAFASLSSNNNAYGTMDSSNIAYMQALLLASYISVCGSFDEYDTILPRPTGVTYQCYNKGALTSTSSPVSTWSNIRFPGYSTNYTGASTYQAFPFYSAIGKFNVLHSYRFETLNIQSAYY